jgi:uncharacterized protein (TIGR00251 family)
MTRPEYVTIQGTGAWLVKVWVQPGARKSEAAGLYQGRLRLKIAAPAVDDKANKAVVRFLAGLLGVKPGCVRLESGRASRGKTLVVQSGAEPIWPQDAAGDNA